MAHQRGHPNHPANSREETDSTTGGKTLSLYPDALNVIWGGPSSTNRYWKRTAPIAGSQIEALELVEVYWLEVSGRLLLSRFTPGKKYKLYFVIQMNQQNSSGWDNYDVCFNIRMAGRKPQERQSMRFGALARNDWHNVPVNGLEFTVPDQESISSSQAALTFAMYDIECEELKKGVRIREVRIEEVN